MAETWVTVAKATKIVLHYYFQKSMNLNCFYVVFISIPLFCFVARHYKHIRRTPIKNGKGIIQWKFEKGLLDNIFAPML